MEAKRKNDGRRGGEWETEKMKRSMDEKNNQKKGVRYWEENSGFNYYRIDNPFPLEEEKKKCQAGKRYFLQLFKLFVFKS